jgi:RNA polymerase sigma-70 factor (ECF subfamily)
MTTPTQGAVRHENERNLRAAIATLNEEQREVLRLRYAEGTPTKDIAKRLKKTDVAVRVMLTRLIQQLQELLGAGA